MLIWRSDQIIDISIFLDAYNTHRYHLTSGKTASDTMRLHSPHLKDMSNLNVVNITTIGVLFVPSWKNSWGSFVDLRRIAPPVLGNYPRERAGNAGDLYPPIISVQDTGKVCTLSISKDSKRGGRSILTRKLMLQIWARIFSTSSTQLRVASVHSSQSSWISK